MTDHVCSNLHDSESWDARAASSSHASASFACSRDPIKVSVFGENNCITKKMTTQTKSLHNVRKSQHALEYTKTITTRRQLLHTVRKLLQRSLIICVVICGILSRGTSAQPHPTAPRPLLPAPENQ